MNKLWVFGLLLSTTFSCAEAIQERLEDEKEKYRVPTLEVIARRYFTKCFLAENPLATKTPVWRLGHFFSIPPYIRVQIIEDLNTDWKEPAGKSYQDFYFHVMHSKILAQLLQWNTIEKVSTLNMGLCKTLPIETGLSEQDIKTVEEIKKHALFRLLKNIAKGGFHNLAPEVYRIDDLNLIETDTANIDALALARKTIRHLDWSNKAMHGRYIEIVAAELPGSHLEMMNLHENYIHEKSIKAIGNALHLSQLKALVLSSTKIGYEGIKAIAEALPHCLLENLDLSKNSVEDKSIELIAKALPQSQLKSLNLSLTRITDKGVGFICEVLEQSPLENLDLSKNNIKEEGVKTIAQKAPSSKLKKLNLWFNRCEHASPIVYDAFEGQPLETLPLEGFCFSRAMNTDTEEICVILI